MHPNTDLVIAPGSRQVLEMLARSGALADMVAAGARILETACGPCIGMGQAPPTGSVSVRTFNRNFKGRSGTADAKVYLTGPETAAATALNGVLTDPRDLGEFIEVEMPDSFIIDDEMVLAPSENPEKVEVLRGPNIKPIPLREELPETLSGSVLLKVGDNITTDDIMPAGAKSCLSGPIYRLFRNMFSQILTLPSLKGLNKWEEDYCRGTQLRPRVQQGTRGPGSNVPGNKGDYRKIFCPYSQGKPNQLWNTPLNIC